MEIIKNYIGDTIKIKVQFEYKKATCEAGNYEYISYKKLIIYDSRSGEIFKNIKDAYSIKRFLINHNIQL